MPCCGLGLGKVVAMTITLSRLGVASIMLAILLAGAMCPGSQPGAGGVTSSGLFVYIARTGGGSSLWVANREGSIVSQLGVGFSPPATPTDGATLSPDRERVAFAMPTDGQLNDIYVIPRNGQSGPVNITNTPEVNEADPDWCRDGSAIAYSAAGDIWSIRPDGTSSTNLTDTPDLVESDPSWSPDGLRVAYTLNSDLSNSDIEVINVATGERTPVAADADLDEFAPSWSPTGGRIAFSGRPLSGSLTTEVVDVYVVELATGARRNVTNARGDVLCVGPAWSPDEAQIAFRGTRKGEPYSHIWSVRPSGSGAGLLVAESGRSETHVDWR